MVNDTDNPCSWEVEAVGAWIQGYPQLYVELKANLIYQIFPQREKYL